MKFKFLLMITLPALLAAGTPNPNNVREASDLLQSLRESAQTVNDNAAELQQFATDSDIDWEVHSAKLEDIKASINDMGHKLDNLKAIQQAALPWQRQAFQRSLPLVRLMADSATAAINSATGSPRYLFNAKYASYQANLYKQSKNLDTLLRNFQELAKVRARDQQLSQGLKIRKKS